MTTTITPGKRKAIIKAYSNICQYCGADEADQIEHIVPRARDGSDDLGNLTLACTTCNRKKAALRLPAMYEGILIARAISKQDQIKHVAKGVRPKKKRKPRVPKRRDLSFWDCFPYWYLSIEPDWIDRLWKAKQYWLEEGIFPDGSWQLDDCSDLRLITIELPWPPGFTAAELYEMSPWPQLIKALWYRNHPPRKFGWRNLFDAMTLEGEPKIVIDFGVGESLIVMLRICKTRRDFETLCNANIFRN